MEILKVFLDAPSTNKSIKNTNTTNFIIRSTDAPTTAPVHFRYSIRYQPSYAICWLQLGARDGLQRNQ